MSTWNLYTWESGHITFCPRRIVTTKGIVNSGFCTCLLPSTWESVNLGFYLLAFCLLGGLDIWNFAHVGCCQLLRLSTLDSTHIWFYVLGNMLIKDFFYFRSCPLGILFTLMLVYWNSVHLGFGPYDSQSVSPHRSAPAIRSLQYGLVHLLFDLFVRRSNWVFVYLDFVYFGVWPHDILSM